MDTKTKNFSKELKNILNEQIEKSKKVIRIGQETTGIGATKVVKDIFSWKGKYDTWLLDPVHIYIHYDVTATTFEKAIIDSENVELIDIWQDYITFHKKVMMYDPEFSIMKRELGEYVHNLFDKSNNAKTDVIIKKSDSKDIELMKEIALLKRKLKNAEETE